jgi:hypothetical protein
MHLKVAGSTNDADTERQFYRTVRYAAANAKPEQIGAGYATSVGSHSNPQSIRAMIERTTAANAPPYDAH